MVRVTSELVRSIRGHIVLEKAEFEHDEHGKLRRVPGDGNTAKERTLAHAGNHGGPFSLAFERRNDPYRG